jgi:hypothetical protein
MRMITPAAAAPQPKTQHSPVKPSLRAAIDRNCRECCFDPKSGLGTWRQQVEACPVTRCALWPVRPRADKRDRRAGETAAPRPTPEAFSAERGSPS